MSEDTSSVRPVPHVTVNVIASAPQMSAFLLGKERNWIVVLLLSIVTLGIYQLVYTYNVFEEVKRFGLVKNPVVHVTSGGAAVGFLFIPLFNVVWALMLCFKYPGLATKFSQILGRQGPSYGLNGFWLLIPVLGGIIVLALTQTKLNDFWREQRLLLQASASKT